MTRRRIYLMRHAQVSYFEDGRPVRPDTVPLTAEGGRQAEAARELLDGISFDRVVTSGLLRTVETWRDVVPEGTRFLGGETIGALLDRVLPAVDRLLADPEWDVLLAVLHGGVNRAVLSYALTGGRAFLGNFEQSPGCVNVLDVADDWVVRAVNIAPTDQAHQRGRLRTMEELWEEFKA